MDYSVNEEIIELFLKKIKNSIFPSKENNYTSKFLQSNLLLFCAFGLLVLRIISVLISVNIPQNIFFADITKSILENMVNQTRQSAGLPKLLVNAKLDQAAQLKAQNMINENYFSHVSPTGISPWFWFSEVGYSYKYAGENLAIGFFESEEVFNAWLNSPSHKANIVSPNYTEMGTAVLKGFGNNNTVVVVQNFGKPLLKEQIVKNTAQKFQKSVTSASNESSEKTVKIQTNNNQPSTATSGIGPASDKKVLSQESESLLEAPQGKKINSAFVRIINYIVYSYNDLLQNITYGFALIIIGALFALIFFSFNFRLNKQLVFRAILLIIILSSAALVNKEFITYLIPHEIII